MEKKEFTRLQPGKLCPFNSTEWETMKKKWNCPDPEFYHCIPDQYNRPGQICVKANWASKNYCPIYNTVAKDIDLIPCDLQYGACSNTDYRSNKVYQYPGCLNKTVIIGETTTETPESPVQLHTVIPAVVVPVAVLVLIIVVAIYYCRRRGAKFDANDVELQPLLPQDGVPLSFIKTVNYLENKVFYRTKSYQDAIGILHTYGHITLIGPPGSGKTFMAVQLARQLCGKEEKSLYFYKTLEEITKLPDLKNVCLHIIMDDWLDHYVYYPSKVEEDVEIFNRIYEDFVKPKLVRVIFTVQEDRWNSCKQHLSSSKLFCSKSCVSINKESFSKEELQGMVINHLKYHGIEERSMSTKKSSEEGETLANVKMDISKNIKLAVAKDLKSEKEFSFPVMIDLICANTFLLPSRTLFFKDGFTKILQTFLDNWLADKAKDEKDSFCIFMFAALRGGKINLSDFTSSLVHHIYKNIFKEFKSECLEDIKDIERLLRENQRLKGCLYQEDDDFVFRHDSVLCFVLQFLIETTDANFLIENADIDILLNRCWIKEGILKAFSAHMREIVQKKPAGAIIIPIEALKNLARRIHEEMVKGYTIPDWPKHVFMKHKTFSEMWKQVCTETNIANLGTLQENLPKIDKSQEKLPYESTVNSKEEKTVQDTEKDADSNETGNDPSLIGPEKKSKQSKQKAKKSEEKASQEKTDSKPDKPGSEEARQRSTEPSEQNTISSTGNDPNPNGQTKNSTERKDKTRKGEDKASKDKTDSEPEKNVFEEEARQRGVESSQQNMISSDLTDGKSTENDPNPHGHAKSSRESEHKTKKKESKLSLLKTKGKSKTKESEKESGVETEENKLFSNLPEGGTALY